VSTTTPSYQAPPLRIDIEKMRRFAQWLFVEDTDKMARGEAKPNDAPSDRRSAA
jgi:hypothetical protein